MILSYHKRPIQAAFFDRDGTLIKDEVYLSEPHKVSLLEGVSDVLSTLRKAGVSCFVVSNQSGVGRGYMWQSEVYAVNARLDALLWEQGKVVIHRYFMCFHRPDEGCDCRKPKPLLLNEACTLYGLNPKDCWFIGNRDTDVEAGKAANMHTFFLGNEASEATASGEHLKDWLSLLDGERGD